MVLIYFSPKILAKFKTFCWEFDSKKINEMEYDLRILVSSVNLICQEFQWVFRYVKKS